MFIGLLSSFYKIFDEINNLTHLGKIKMRKTTLMYLMSLVILVMMMIQPVSSSSADNVPILQPQTVTGSFSPTVIGDNSYYTVNSNLYFPGITYQSDVPGVFTSTDW